MGIIYVVYYYHSNTQLILIICHALIGKNDKCANNCCGTSKSRFCIPAISHDNWEKSFGKSLNI